MTGVQTCALPIYAQGRHNGSIQLVWCTHLPDLTSQVGPLPDMNGADCTSDKHCVIGMHRMKSLEASVSILHRVYDAQGRHNGSIQLVWCTHLPDLISQVGPLPEMNGADCTSHKHCVIGMHRMKSLEASVSVLHRVYDAQGRHNGSFQVVWCTHLPDLISQVGPLLEMNGANCTSDKHGARHLFLPLNCLTPTLHPYSTIIFFLAC